MSFKINIFRHVIPLSKMMHILGGYFSSVCSLNLDINKVVMVSFFNLKLVIFLLCPHENICCTFVWIATTRRFQLVPRTSFFCE